MIRPWFLCCLLWAAATAASAQAPPAPATPPQATAPPPSPNTADCAPTTPNGSGVTVGQSNEALGDRLAKSNGVLCPPSGVDPQMRAPTPDNSGKMPVIPPPGSPGGDPNVRPK